MMKIVEKRNECKCRVFYTGNMKLEKNRITKVLYTFCNVGLNQGWQIVYFILHLQLELMETDRELIEN